MTDVFLCSPTNSTMFTKCCKAAVCRGDTACPLCSRAIDANWDEAFRESMSPAAYAAHKAHVARQIAMDRKIEALRRAAKQETPHA